MTIHDHIREMRERAEKATSGPWLLASNDARQNINVEMASEIVPEYDPKRILVTLRATAWKQKRWGNALPNAEFIAASRTDLPALADALEIAVKCLEEINGINNWNPATTAEKALVVINERLNRKP